MSGWLDGVRHAFALDGPAPLGPQDEALLERLAGLVVRRGLGLPAAVALEATSPLAFLGGQALHVLAPGLDLLLEPGEAARFAGLMERRDVAGRLAARIRELESPAGRAG
ncbi:MAG: hypothetical protein HY722_10335 [Planctomycetes bacterium]|nr:hypothetical protein [Planctomycetota bacterium]